MRRRRYPRNVYPFVDMDYAARLSPADRAYLETFSAEYYNGEFDGASPLHSSEEQRREIGRVKHARVEDIYERANRSAGDGDLGSTEASHPDAWATPAHLGDNAYRKALSEFRAHLPEDNRRKVNYSAGFLASRSNLDGLAGVLSSSRNNTEVEEAMSKSRLERLKESRQIVWNIGHLLAKSTFKGEESGPVAQGLGWLEQMLGKFDAKLKALGYEPKPPTEGGQ